MTIQEIDAILAEHSIEHTIRPAYDKPDGALRVMALDVVIGPNGEDASTWVDIAGWTLGRLYRWLGY